MPRHTPRLWAPWPHCRAVRPPWTRQASPAAPSRRLCPVYTPAFSCAWSLSHPAPALAHVATKQIPDLSQEGSGSAAPASQTPCSLQRGRGRVGQRGVHTGVLRNGDGAPHSSFIHSCVQSPAGIPGEHQGRPQGGAQALAHTLQCPLQTWPSGMEASAQLCLPPGPSPWRGGRRPPQGCLAARQGLLTEASGARFPCCTRWLPDGGARVNDALVSDFAWTLGSLGTGISLCWGERPHVNAGYVLHGSWPCCRTGPHPSSGRPGTLLRALPSVAGPGVSGSFIMAAMWPPSPLSPPSADPAWAASS